MAQSLRQGWLEVVRPYAREIVALQPGERVTIGRGEGNDIVLQGDKAVSRVHASSTSGRRPEDFASLADRMRFADREG